MKVINQTEVSRNVYINLINKNKEELDNIIKEGSEQERANYKAFNLNYDINSLVKTQASILKKLLTDLRIDSLQGWNGKFYKNVIYVNNIKIDLDQITEKVLRETLEGIYNYNLINPLEKNWGANLD